MEVGSSAIRKELGSIAHDSERRETGDVLYLLSPLYLGPSKGNISMREEKQI